MLRFLLISLISTAPIIGAELGSEIALRHQHRAAGTAPLQSLYVEGRTIAKDEVIEFKLWAARPNQLRMLSVSAQRSVLQVFDGKNEPLISHNEIQDGEPLRMAGAERSEFIANADFDGPLVNFALKGYTVDYAGEEKVNGRPASKLLMMSANDDIFFVWVDQENSEIVRRSVFRVVREKRILVDTYFSDFRPVAGTLQPHRIETKVGDKTLYAMIVTRVEVNSAEVVPECFTVPKDWPRLAMGLSARAAQGARSYRLR